MAPTNNPPGNAGPDDAVRLRILARAWAINAKLMTRFSVVSDDLDSGSHRAALGGLMGAETDLENLRCLLQLLEP
jgi:hypothetical protein